MIKDNLVRWIIISIPFISIALYALDFKAEALDYSTQYPNVHNNCNYEQILRVK